MTAGAYETEFYTKLFVENPQWNTRYPNYEEAPRAAVILQFLAQATERRAGNRRPLRILDLGCGRGWLTYLAQAYGECLGVDPIGPVVDFAGRLFPDLRFRRGTARDLVPEFRGAFDLLIASEVIEHIPPAERDAFAEDVKALLRSDGAAIISSDRGELYRRWLRTQPHQQPVEDWLTEADLRHLFVTHGFSATAFDRVYWDFPALSWLHRLAASRRLQRLLAATGQRWLSSGLRFLAGFGQVWLFERR